MVMTTGRPGPAGVRNPSTRPATTSQAAVPSTISTAARVSARNVAPAAIARIDDRPTDAQTRGRRDADTAELEHAVRGDQREERPAVARADRQARDRAEQHAVLQQHEQRAEAEQQSPPNANMVTVMLLVKI